MHHRLHQTHPKIAIACTIDYFPFTALPLFRENEVHMKIVRNILIGLVVVIALGFFFGTIGMGDIKKMSVGNVDLSAVNDGVYTGKFSKARWKYAFEVTVKDHRITAINTGANVKSGFEKIVNGAVDAIIKKQSLDIDVVSGASIDTKAIRKAVENALTSGVAK
jgi:uncharacterized protein with FMN-binding domain